jgi:hypothetical protein
MMIDIFNKRWYGIQGETVGEGKYAMNTIRVQTSDQGPWQALNETEIASLLSEHNQAVHTKVPRHNIAAQVKKLGTDSLLPPKKPVAKKKGKKK